MELQSDIEVKKDCSKSNASHIMLLAYDVRDGCCGYGNRGWTFPLTFYYTLLPCNDSSKGALGGVWHGSADEAKECHWYNLCRKKNKWHHWHLLMLTEHLWRPNSGCEHKWGGKWCVSAVAAVTVGRWCRLLWAQHAVSWGFEFSCQVGNVYKTSSKRSD